MIGLEKVEKEGGLKKLAVISTRSKYELFMMQ